MYDNDNENENYHPDGTVPSSRGTPTRSISVGSRTSRALRIDDDGAFRVPKESLAEGGALHTTL